MTQYKFAFCVENEVFGIATVSTDPETNPRGAEIVEGYLSNPIIIEIPQDINAQIGWGYDGTNFIEPTE